jgi:hypothetical protein
VLLEDRQVYVRVGISAVIYTLSKLLKQVQKIVLEILSQLCSRRS